MAGPSIGTWVKVRSKSGGTTPRVLAKKYGGGAYQQGQVITQSEYNAYKEKRAEGKAPNERQSETKKARAKEDVGIEVKSRGAGLAQQMEARKKREKEINNRAKNNQSINTLGVKGKTQNREFKIAESGGDRVVKGSVRGAFGIHNDGPLTIITHLPTGMAVARLQPKLVRTRGGSDLKTKADIKKASLSLIDKLNGIPGVEQSSVARDANSLVAMRGVITDSLDGRY